MSPPKAGETAYEIGSDYITRDSIERLNGELVGEWVVHVRKVV